MVYGECTGGFRLIVHEGVALMVYQNGTDECFPINHKPDCRLTGL